MATVKTHRKPYLLSRRRCWCWCWRRTRFLQGRPQRPPPVRKRKVPLKSKKNVCIFKLPRCACRDRCPLLFLGYQRWKAKRATYVRGHTCSKAPPSPAKKRRAAPPPRRPRRCPDFLQAALREMARQEQARSAAKGRKGYTDEEIFYRLAKPCPPPGGGPSVRSRTKVVTLPAPGRSPLAASERREVWG